MANALRKPADPASKSPNESLDAALARIRAADDFPAISGRIQQLMEVLGDEDVSVQRLANLIIQDYGLSVKLLRVANSFRFNRSGAPVVSATHAIVMMGAAAVRDLVSTIVVWEHYRRRAPGLRPLLMLSLLSANHARELAAQIGVAGREEAYLLGMLRNLGEVLVACYLPDQYAAVLKDMADRQCPESASCRRVLHFEYEDLARAVIVEWGMPASITRTLSDASVPDKMHTVVTFAHGLTAAVYRHAAGSSQQAVKMLLQKYSSLGLTRDDVSAMLEAGIEGTRETFAQAGVHLNELHLKHQMTMAMIEKPDAVDASSGAKDAADAQTISAERVKRLTRDITQAIENDRIDLNKIILIVLEATLSAGGFNRAILALVSSTRRELCGRLGLGQTDEQYVGRFRFQLGPAGGPIGVAVSRGQELTVARSWELMPDEQRLLRTLDAGALMVLPLRLDGRIIGALYVDTTRTSQPSEAAITVAREMRDAIVNAMARRQQPGAGEVTLAKGA